MRRLFFVFLAFLSACELPGDPSGADAGEDEGDASKAPIARPVKVRRLSPGRFVETIEITGRVEAIDDVTLSARGSGTLVSRADRGARVTKGETIARIDPGLPKAALAQAAASVSLARAGVALAQDIHDRQAPLHAKGIISTLEFNRVRAQLAQAQAQLAQAQAGRRQAGEQVRSMVVIAPFSGRVEAGFAEVGEQVNPGSPIIRVVASDPIAVKAGVPERYVSDVHVKTPVEVRFGAYNQKPRTGAVYFVGGAIEAKSRTFEVEVRLPNPDGALKPQMTARLRLTRGTTEKALTVPQTAVLRDGESTAVFVVRGDKAHRVVIQVGPSADGQIRVERGLSAGEQVVIRGQGSLEEGDLVRIEGDGA